MSSGSFVSIVVAGLGSAVLAFSSTPRTQVTTAVVFEGARLIAGDGGAPIENSALLVRDGRILASGRRDELRDAAGAVRVDLAGKTVMPAMIDAHVHLGYRKGTTFSSDNFTRDTILEQLNRFAYYGVGAVLSTGTDRGDLVLRLRDEPHAGALVRTAWRGIAMPNGGPFPPMRDAAFGVTSENEARSAVRELAAKKADLVKIWVDDRNGTVPKLTPDLYRAIIDEAHAHNLRVLAHTMTLADVKDLVRAGIDGFAHLFRDREVDDELLALLKDRPNVFFMLTLWAPRLATSAEKPAWLADARLRETVAADVLDQFGRALTSRTPEAIRAAREDWVRLAHNVVRLSTAGVQLALGTDAGGNTGWGLFGWTEHIELENMVAAGLTPSQAIEAATRVPAHILRLDDLGTLTAGKSADFIVLDANPLSDITNSRAIAEVYLRGEEFDRRSIRIK